VIGPVTNERGTPVAPKKTLVERETELRALLATPAGREELRLLEARCRAGGAKFRPERASIVTYILVHERSLGLIGEPNVGP
jgi:hypothetical protein